MCLDVDLYVLLDFDSVCWYLVVAILQAGTAAYFKYFEVAFSGWLLHIVFILLLQYSSTMLTDKSPKKKKFP